MVESNIELKKSEKLFQRSKKIFPGGVNSPVRAFEPYPFFVDCANKSKLFSVDQKSYIDYCMSYGALILGHANSEIVAAVKNQLLKGSLYGVTTEIELELAEQIHKFFPCMEMLRLVNSGTEATMHALRVARGFTGRNKILKFEGGFHGAHDSVLVKAGSGSATFGVPSSLGVPKEVTLNTIVLSYNDVGAFEEKLSKIGNEIAAVIVEPVMCNSGLILPSLAFLKKLRELTLKYNIVLIFDEVITGFRLGLSGAQGYYNIEPDMTTIGKVIGGGFPLAVYGGKKEIMQQITPSGKVYQAGTFSGNPISTIAGLKTLEILSNPKNDIYSSLEKKCGELKKALLDLSSNYNLDVYVNNIASMFQIFFTSDEVVDFSSVKTSNLRMFQAYFHELLNQKVFVPPAQFETCFLSVAHDESDLKRTVEAFDRALYVVSKLKGSGIN